MRKTATRTIWLLIISAIFSVSPLWAQSSEETTFIIVRHGEKADDSQDPDLSEIGAERAQRLAALLASFNIDGVYSTPYKRTRQTVGPTAEANGVEVQDYNPRAANPLLDELKTQSGKVFLIAGHSNTAPLLVNHLLGEKKYEVLDESVYGNVWIVTVPVYGTPTVMLLHY